MAMTRAMGTGRAACGALTAALFVAWTVATAPAQGQMLMGGGKMMECFDAMRRGGNRMATGDYDGAIAEFTACLSCRGMMDGGSQCYTLRGRAKALKGDRDGAFADFNEGIGVAGRVQFPKYHLALAHAGRGLGNALLNDLDGAIADYDTALQYGEQAAGGATLGNLMQSQLRGWQPTLLALQAVKAGGHAAAKAQFDQAAVEYADAKSLKEHFYSPKQTQAAPAPAAGANPNAELINAAMAGDTEKVRRLLLSGVDANAKNPHGRTALMHAALNGHTEAAKALLAAGADVHAKDKDGTTALMVAERRGHAGTAELLRRAEALEAAK